ncbi:hypothetical protein [Lacrimispora amygdalina]|jgi:hypothetical protein|uniref:hypothetical protein n=1 Tax=Lacrimispora amygdalina TaxID=253257 RepID=UPI000BE3B9A6|nr:hypothetical protein [Lacrimispora amygdalina]
MNNHMRYWAIGMILGFAILLIAVFTAANWYKIKKAAPQSLPSVEVNRNLDNVLAENQTPLS